MSRLQPASEKAMLMMAVFFIGLVTGFGVNEKINHEKYMSSIPEPVTKEQKLDACAKMVLDELNKDTPRIILVDVEQLKKIKASMPIE